ncbi:MAG TPA: hypothetical protein VEH48_01180 [Candidatus Nitrosopolaris sp.]|nr:hypothetical protein [Candidatus Nitrosopolaris sp.]
MTSTGEDLQAEPLLETDRQYYYFPGIIMGFVLAPEVVQRVREAAEAAEDNREKNQKPPKPPKRPNARIGYVALAGNT